jgi:Ras-related protein Rab-4B
LLVYDITSRQSFVNLGRWLTDCRALASAHLAVVLVGNKLDKEEEREVEYAEGAKWAEENGRCLEGTGRSSSSKKAERVEC